MQALLLVTAFVEVSTGLALVVVPSSMVSILVGASAGALSEIVVARVTGAALLALGLACWLARDEPQSRAARGLIAAMLLYDVATVGVLAHAHFGLKLSAIGLWPAVLLHALLAVWCVICLWTPSSRR
jgi:hypothetical protein